MPFPDEPTPLPNKYQFRLPNLPKPEYQALKKLCDLLEATQWEVVCLGLRALAAAFKQDPARARTALADFRATAPSETPPLV